MNDLNLTDFVDELIKDEHEFDIKIDDNYLTTIEINHGDSLEIVKFDGDKIKYRSFESLK